jgi:hypothetical protein
VSLKSLQGYLRSLRSHKMAPEASSSTVRYRRTTLKLAIWCGAPAKPLGQPSSSGLITQQERRINVLRTN